MILIALVALVIVVSLRGLPATLSGDGLGHRPGPRSHVDDEFVPPRRS